MNGNRNFRHQRYTQINKKEKKSHNLIDSTILIALVSALGYYMAYSYKEGYLTYYGITEVFYNQISLITLIYSVSEKVGMVIFFLFAIFSFVNVTFSEVKSSILIVFRDIFTPIFILLNIIILFTDANIFILLLISIILLFCLYTFPFIIYWKVKGYKNKLEKMLKRFQHLNIRIILSTIKEKPLLKYELLAILFILLPGLASKAGDVTAQFQEDYLMIDYNGESYLVINNVEDNFIISPFDIESKSVKMEYIVIENKSDFSEPIIFKRVKVVGGVKPIYDEEQWID